jgi:hypothetical protein
MGNGLRYSEGKKREGDRCLVVATTDRLFLNALVASQGLRELRTIGFSSENLEALLDERPAAITLSRAGLLAPERLLQAWEDQADLVTSVSVAPDAATRYCLFEVKTPVARELESNELVNPEQLKAKMMDIATRYALFPDAAAVWIIVPELPSTSPLAPETWRVLLRNVIAHSWAEPVRSAANNGAESDRDALLRERQRMLDAVGTSSSEDLATAAGSATSNASQFAADQRSTGRLFGVRFGQAWHYPKFQFGDKGRVLDDMKAVLRALSPDDQGWDRLQWFLEPHEKLGGRVPLEVWKTDRRQVIEAANTERWNGCD